MAHVICQKNSYCKLRFLTKQTNTPPKKKKQKGQSTKLSKRHVFNIHTHKQLSGMWS